MSKPSPALPGHATILNVMDTLVANFLKGKVRSVRLALIALLTEGHVLLEDLPGLGKTTLALALARSLGLSFGRVQCTSDLLPSDITGLSVYHRDEHKFSFNPGPVFNNVLLVDEINRAMPKTQSALLESMEEMRVTVDGKTYPLPEPFLVIATQNPMEQVGTYPLPESQLDRFMVTTGIGYPSASIERTIISEGSVRNKLVDITPMVSAEEILTARTTVKDGVLLSEKVVDYIYSIVEASRSHSMVQTGISTRGAIGIALAARANAFLSGRDYVIPEDVKELVVPVAAHRLILHAENEGLNKSEVLQSIVAAQPVPLA